MLACTPIALTEAPQATDPLLGLKYSSVAVPFPMAPENLSTLCKALTNQRYDRKMWVFAQTHDSTGPQFMVIGGFYVKRAGGPSAAEADTQGAVLKLNGDSCQAVGAARDVFESPPAEVSASTLSALAHDAACTYSRAFGSWEKLQNALRRQRITIKIEVLKQAFSRAPEGCI